ncbi:MAG: DNA-processing protein DprA [Dysosmobacter sp.]
MSEYPPGTRPDGRHFPVRNRILSGLSLAALVVEAPARSGALITAETALEQGRDVFAVPGPIDALTSAGCNRLIRDGAGLVSDAWDILREYQDRFPDKLHPEGARREPETLGYRARQSREAKPVLPSLSLKEEKLELTDDQIALLRALPEEEPMLVDDLIEQTGIPTRRVLSALTVLELEQLIEQHSGKRYTRKVNLFE